MKTATSVKDEDPLRGMGTGGDGSGDRSHKRSRERNQILAEARSILAGARPHNTDRDEESSYGSRDRAGRVGLLPTNSSGRDDPVRFRGRSKSPRNGDATRNRKEKRTSQNFPAGALREDNVQASGKSRSLRDSHGAGGQSGSPRRSRKPPMGDHDSLAGIRAVQSRTAHRRSASHHDRLGRDTSHSRDQPSSSSSINLRPVKSRSASPPSRRLLRGGKKLSQAEQDPLGFMGWDSSLHRDNTQTLREDAINSCHNPKDEQQSRQRWSPYSGVAAKNTSTDNVRKKMQKSTDKIDRDISHSRNEWESSPVRGLRTLASNHSPAVPGSPHRTKFHSHTTGLHQSSPPPSVIPKSSRPPMQGTTHEVGNDRRGNGSDDGSRCSRGKQRTHPTIPTSSAYIEEPRTNDNSFSSEQDDLLGSLGLGKYGGSGEHSFDQSHCSANFAGGFLPVGSKITDMTHRERKAKLMARRGRKNIEVVGVAGEQCDGRADNDGSKKGGYKSQLSDDPPGDYIGTSQPTEDPPGDVNSDWRNSGSFESSVAERTSGRDVLTSRDPIPFETGDERKEPNSIRWEKMRAVEDSNSEGKGGTATVEPQSHEKSRGGALSPRYSPQAPLPTPPCSNSSSRSVSQTMRRRTRGAGSVTHRDRTEGMLGGMGRSPSGHGVSVSSPGSRLVSHTSLLTCDTNMGMNENEDEVFPNPVVSILRDGGVPSAGSVDMTGRELDIMPTYEDEESESRHIARAPEEVYEDDIGMIGQKHDCDWEVVGKDVKSAEIDTKGLDKKSPPVHPQELGIMKATEASGQSPMSTSKKLMMKSSQYLVSSANDLDPETPKTKKKEQKKKKLKLGHQRLDAEISSEDTDSANKRNKKKEKKKKKKSKNLKNSMLDVVDPEVRIVADVIKHVSLNIHDTSNEERSVVYDSDTTNSMFSKKPHGKEPQQIAERTAAGANGIFFDSLEIPKSTDAVQENTQVTKETNTMLEQTVAAMNVEIRQSRRQFAELQSQLETLRLMTKEKPLPPKSLQNSPSSQKSETRGAQVELEGITEDSVTVEQPTEDLVMDINVRLPLQESRLAQNDAHTLELQRQNSEIPQMQRAEVLMAPKDTSESIKSRKEDMEKKKKKKKDRKKEKKEKKKEKKDKKRRRSSKKKSLLTSKSKNSISSWEDREDGHDVEQKGDEDERQKIDLESAESIGLTAAEDRNTLETPVARAKENESHCFHSNFILSQREEDIYAVANSTHASPNIGQELSYGESAAVIAEHDLETPVTTSKESERRQSREYTSAVVWENDDILLLPLMGQDVPNAKAASAAAAAATILSSDENNFSNDEIKTVKSMSSAVSTVSNIMIRESRRQAEMKKNSHYLDSAALVSNKTDDKVRISFGQVCNTMRDFILQDEEDNNEGSISTADIVEGDKMSESKMASFWARCAIRVASVIIRDKGKIGNHLQLAQRASEAVFQNCRLETSSNWHNIYSKEAWREEISARSEDVAAKVSLAVLNGGGTEAMASSAAIVILNEMVSFFGEENKLKRSDDADEAIHVVYSIDNDAISTMNEEMAVLSATSSSELAHNGQRALGDEDAKTVVDDEVNEHRSPGHFDCDPLVDSPVDSAYADVPAYEVDWDQKSADGLTYVEREESTAFQEENELPLVRSYGNSMKALDENGGYHEHNGSQITKCKDTEYAPNEEDSLDTTLNNSLDQSKVSPEFFEYEGHNHSEKHAEVIPFTAIDDFNEDFGQNDGSTQSKAMEQHKETTYFSIDAQNMNNFSSIQNTIQDTKFSDASEICAKSSGEMKIASETKTVGGLGYVEGIPFTAIDDFNEDFGKNDGSAQSKAMEQHKGITSFSIDAQNMNNFSSIQNTAQGTKFSDASEICAKSSGETTIGSETKTMGVRNISVTSDSQGSQLHADKRDSWDVPKTLGKTIVLRSKEDSRKNLVRTKQAQGNHNFDRTEKKSSDFAASQLRRKIWGIRQRAVRQKANLAEVIKKATYTKMENMSEEEDTAGESDVLGTGKVPSEYDSSACSPVPRHNFVDQVPSVEDTCEKNNELGTGQGSKENKISTGSTSSAKSTESVSMILGPFSVTNEIHLQSDHYSTELISGSSITEGYEEVNLAPGKACIAHQGDELEIFFVGNSGNEVTNQSGASEKKCEERPDGEVGWDELVDEIGQDKNEFGQYKEENEFMQYEDESAFEQYEDENEFRQDEVENVSRRDDVDSESRQDEVEIKFRQEEEEVGQDEDEVLPDEIGTGQDENDVAIITLPLSVSTSAVDSISNVNNQQDIKSGKQTPHTKIRTIKIKAKNKELMDASSLKEGNIEVKIEGESYFETGTRSDVSRKKSAIKTSMRKLFGMRKKVRSSHNNDCPIGEMISVHNVGNIPGQVALDVEFK